MLPSPLGHGIKTHDTSSGGWSRTNGLLVQSQASLPTATAPDRAASLTQHHAPNSGRTTRTSIAWFKARQPTVSRSPNSCEFGVPSSEFSATKHSELRTLNSKLPQSAQRELNPRFRHGKAAGYRYIMGAQWRIELSKNREHRAGVEPALPRYECGVFTSGRPVLANDLSVGPEGLEPSPTWLRARHAATSTLIPFS